MTASVLMTLLPFQEIPETLESPLPTGISVLVRYMFGLPQWFQIGGAIVGLIVAGFVVWYLWKRRLDISTWFHTRSGPVLAALGVGVVLFIAVGAAFGVKSWHYMQHDNEFCIACHVMDPSFIRFEQSEHSQLECHDCHQQPISASMRQLYLWVLERPEDIGTHAPVADEVCARCHIQDDPGERWQRISATAGHRVHLESDMERLGEVMCVTCHGTEVHRFVPPDQTCGQAGCHEPEETRVQLGAMASQTGLHCVTCHEFTAEVGEHAPVTNAAQGLMPAAQQCFSCHDMQSLIRAFDADQDPHEGVCSMCHNPHVQPTPAAAWTTCTGAGCHDSIEQLTPFHRGIHAGVLEQCSTCHTAHTWEVTGTDCRACHQVLP